MVDDRPQQDRTEAPTARRLQRAREDGRVPLSRETPLLAALVAVTIVMFWAGKILATGLTARLAGLLANADKAGWAGPHALRVAWTTVLHGGAPFVVVASAASIAATLLQTGFAVRSYALSVDLGRIGFATGLNRLFGRDNAIEALKSVAKITVTTVALWWWLRDDLTMWRQVPHWAPQTLLAQAAASVLRVLLVVIAVQAILVALDLIWVRVRHVQQLRMTRQDLREEQRETEGDPTIKARVKQVRAQRARKRMLAAVPNATVIVTNPTHYAIALAYDPRKHTAPKLVAKGIDSLAARIREVAAAHGVPMVANPPLAQALYRVELDSDIPVEHYQAVAEIIAYIWRLNQRLNRVPQAA